MTKTYLLRALMLCSILVLLLQQSWAQTKTISGTVSDDKGAPIIGASVLAKGTKTGTTTDAAGAFKLSVPTAATAIVVSYVGFSEKEIDITSTSSVQVSLVPANAALTDVVVVGYGTARKKDVTGAVASISSKDFNQGAITDPMQQVQGKVSGLLITQPGGDPNGSLIIRLRGQASLTGSQTPLIVLDGVPLFDPNQISNIPPGDIASFDFLKDASAAAIYGSRAANGVIIVNTKKAAAGQAVVDYNGYVTVDNVAKKYPLLDASQWKSASLNYLTTGAGAVSADSAGKIIAGYDKGGNTDWQDAILRTGLTHNHNVSISGGAAHFNYRASASYMNQDGIVINTGKEGMGLHFNGQEKALNDKLDIQFGIDHTQYNRNYADYGIFSYPLFNVPTLPVYNKDGSYYGFTDFSVANPVMHQMLETHEGKEFLTILKGVINYTLIPGLKIGAQGSLSHFNQQYQWFQPAFFNANHPDQSEGNYNNGYQKQYNNDLKSGDFHANYSTRWGKNNLDATAVYEFNYFEDDFFQAGAQQFIVPQTTINNLSAGNTVFNGVSSSKEAYILKSYVGRVNYNWDNKYYITGTIRRDGSSKFGADNRFGNFPSVSASWAISQENFMKGITWLNFLKIRAGFGVTGNSDAISPYSSLFLVSSGNHYFNPSSATFPYPSSYAPSQNSNPSLKWEERHGRNIGFEFGVLNNRLTGDFNYFNDKTKNLLYYYTVPTPPFYINNILANVGDLTNKGEELNLRGVIVSNKNFTWELSGQLTVPKTTVTNLSGSYTTNLSGKEQTFKLTTEKIPGGYAEGRGLSSNPITFLEVGYSPYTFYLPHFMGVDKDGNQLFADGKGGKTDYNHAQYYYTDPSAKFFYSFTNSFTYGNWNLNFQFNGVAGQKIFNNTALNEAFIKRLPGNNIFESALNNGIKDAATASDLYLEKAGFLRLNNLTLGYSFKNVKGLKNLRFYASGTNLFVITKYSGLDPEIRSANTNESYIDATYGGDGYYYRSRSVTFGVNVSFN